MVQLTIYQGQAWGLAERMVLWSSLHILNYQHEKAQCHINHRPISCSPYLACLWASISSSGMLSGEDVCWQILGNFYLCSYWAVVSWSVSGAAVFRYGRNIYNVRRHLNILSARPFVLTCCQGGFCPGPAPDTSVWCPGVVGGWKPSASSMWLSILGDNVCKEYLEGFSSSYLEKAFFQGCFSFAE